MFISVQFIWYDEHVSELFSVNVALQATAYDNATWPKIKTIYNHIVYLSSYFIVYHK